MKETIFLIISLVKHFLRFPRYLPPFETKGDFALFPHSSLPHILGPVRHTCSIVPHMASYVITMVTK